MEACGRLVAPAVFKTDTRCVSAQVRRLMSRRTIFAWTLCGLSGCDVRHENRDFHVPGLRGMLPTNSTPPRSRRWPAPSQSLPNASAGRWPDPERDEWTRSIAEALHHPAGHCYGIGG